MRLCRPLSFITRFILDYKDEVVALTSSGKGFFVACKNETLNKGKFKDLDKVSRLMGKAEERAETMKATRDDMKTRCDKMLRDALKDLDKKRPFVFERIDKASKWQKWVNDMEGDVLKLKVKYPITGRERG